MSEQARNAMILTPARDLESLHFLGFSPGASGVPWWSEKYGKTLVGLAPERYGGPYALGGSLDEALQEMSLELERR